jgi:hypothetical protein
LAVLQLILPAPRDCCAYVTIATPSVYLLDSYTERLAHIGRTFTFDTQTAVTAASGHPPAPAAVRAPHDDDA